MNQLEELDKFFKTGKISKAPGALLNGALDILSEQTSVDSKWINKTLIIINEQNQRTYKFYQLIIIILTILNLILFAFNIYLAMKFTR